MDRGETNLRQGSFENTWNVKSLLLSERLVQSAAARHLWGLLIIFCHRRRVPFGHFIQFNCDVTLRRTRLRRKCVLAFFNPSKHRNDWLKSWGLPIVHFFRRIHTVLSTIYTGFLSPVDKFVLGKFSLVVYLTEYANFFPPREMLFVAIAMAFWSST